MAKKSIVQKPVLDNSNVQKLLAKAKKDSKFKAELIQELNKSGLRDCIKNRFGLNRHQVQELSTITERDTEEVFTKAILASLLRNGKIELVTENHNPPNMSVNFYARKGRDGYEVGVTVTC